MGGTSSTKRRETENFDLYVKALQRDKEKYLLNRDSCIYNPQNNSRCSPYQDTLSVCVPSMQKKILPNSKWKVYLIDQLKMLNTSEWAILLLKTVKSWSYDSSDLMYQSQIQWIEFNNNRSPKIAGNQTIIDRASIISNSEHKALQNDPMKSTDRLGEEILSKVLDQTDLLEESFFAAHGRLSLPTKSIHTHKNRLSHADSDKNSFLLNQDRCNESVSHIEHASIASYKNNTFINNVPPMVTESNVGLPGANQSSIYNQLLLSVNNYKLVTDLIEKHMQTPSNVFQKIITRFSAFFIKKCEKIIQEQKSKTISREASLKLTDAAVSDLQQFIRLLYESINLFYCLDALKLGEMNSKENLFNRDNMINFITSVVLTDQMHRVVFELLRVYDTDTEEKFNKNLAHCKKILPEDVGVPPEFCLNRKTLDYYFEDEKTESQSLVAQNDDTLIVLGDDHQGLKEPYAQCIMALKRLKMQRSPIHKLKTIIKTAELINITIRKFYQRFKIEKSFKLDSDQTLSILLYIVARSDLSNLATHIKIIEKFTTSNVLNSISGYYATNLEACISCLINMDLSKKDELFDSKGLSEGVQVENVSTC